MFTIDTCTLPENALLDIYKGNGTYIDCYCTEITRLVSHSQFVNAFYTTALFRLERIILKWIVSKPSTDSEVSLLAEGKADIFAAWSVEERGKNQLLMRDFQNRTRSWFMVEPFNSSGRTKLYFGSAVVPTKNASTGESSFSFAFKSLLWCHKIYSIALLFSAKARLNSQEL